MLFVSLEKVTEKSGGEENGKKKAIVYSSLFCEHS